MTDIICNVINFLFSFFLKIPFFSFDFSFLDDTINLASNVFKYFNFFIDTSYLLKLFSFYFIINTFVFNFNLMKLIRFMLPFI